MLIFPWIKNSENLVGVEIYNEREFGIIKRTFFNFKEDYAKVSLDEQRMEEIKKPMLMAWVAKTIPYDVYCFYEKKCTIKKRNVVDRNGKVAWEEHEEQIVHFWDFYFCDPQDAILFKMRWS
jgi:hypothetical protein